MNLSALAFPFRECFFSIRRNGLMSLAALGTVTVALTVLGASLWAAQRLSEYADQQPQKFNQVDVFLKPDAERAAAVNLQNRIRQIPDVRAVTLVTREQALSRLESSDPKLTEALEGNPLPDKLEIEAVRASGINSLARVFQDKARFPEIDNVNDAGDEIRQMLALARLIRVIGGSAAAGLFIATLFIVQNTIRLTVFARRKEIRIMQLVGATPGFIRLPLLLEGIFHGVIGAAIASAILLFSGHQLSAFVAQLHSPLVGEVPARLKPPDIVIGLLAIGASIGFIGSFLSARKFLRQV